ncbi:MAG: hypoxanthine phosphoribosyltransferase [Planctomycetes bacterium]|nr:hypoxanthine phosphoribosyltransferase [Planctomycetota bacterium]
MRTLLTETELQKGVSKMAAKIEETYSGRQLTIVGILTGSIVLLADLIRLIDIPMRVGVIEASSYRGATTERGELTINSELLIDIADRDVLLVDDIFDTGHTITRVIEKMRELGPNSIHSAVLLHKKERQEVDYTPDYSAFHIPNEFVVGYGLDYEDMYRNLPFLGVLEEADLEKHASLA